MPHLRLAAHPIGPSPLVLLPIGWVCLEGPILTHLIGDSTLRYATPCLESKDRAEAGDPSSGCCTLALASQKRGGHRPSFGFGPRSMSRRVQ